MECNPRSDQGGPRNNLTQYQCDTDIGYTVSGDGPRPMCWLHATRTGSAFRFMTHHCDPNAMIDHGRCGLHNRILYVYPLEDIPEGGQITINYGKEWFWKEGEPCRCGNEKCVNAPKEVKKGVMLKKQRAEAPKKTKETREAKEDTPPPKTTRFHQGL
jgi:hypothetical protein